VRPEVEAAGCSWVDEVTTDGNLVTAQACPDPPEWIAQFLGVLGTEIEHTADD
jgi:protease I